MEETGHGRTKAVSSAGAQGLMQFMPATWVMYGVDGDGDGRATITDDADSIYTAANYLTKMGVSTGGEAGVRTAIFGYNHANWYVDDVLYYAQAYGGGTILGDPSDCGPGGNGNPNLPPLTGERVTTMLTWAKAQRSASPTSSAQAGLTRTTAQGSPAQPSPRSASPFPEQLEPSATGSPPATATGSLPAKSDRET